MHVVTPNNANNSSRAHSFITITIKENNGIVGKVTLIDMAGSEDVSIIRNY
jgi:hypothetical protein